MKKTIDIQTLLEWTYAEECADRGGWLDARLDAPHYNGSNMAALLNLAALGCMVDGEGTPDHQLRGFDPQPDAVCIHAEVMALPDSDTRTLIIQNAILRRAPDPLIGERIYVDPRAASGEMRIAMQYRDQRYRNDPISCTIPWRGGDLDMIADARGEYALWRCALDLLFDALDGKLANHTVTRSILPYEPWAMDSPVDPQTAVY